MADPFKIDGQTAIPTSGGRSSALLLHRALQANGGLPDGSIAMFCNTGKEEEATLEFVRDMSIHWGIPIVWLEYRPGSQFKVVTFETASRNGEPFEAIIAQRGGVLPNPRSRYCSSEMKTRTMHRYLRSLGWTEWETMLGIRADEPRRVAKFRFNPHPETKDEYVRIPLADAFVSAQDVGEFWKAQPFDLQLPNIKGKTMHGNCDLCLAGETEVVTREGIRRIRELAGQTPDLLIPKTAFGKLSEVGSFAPAPVRSFGTQRLWRIVLAGHGRAEKTIYATAEHRWFLSRKEPRASIPEGDVQTQALKPGDRLRSLFRSPIGEERGSSSKIGALRGFIFGDGTIPTGDRPAVLNLHEGKDEVFKPAFDLLCGAGVEAKSSTGKRYWRYYGIPRYWKLGMPSLTESRHYLMGWLAGWFAADGCVDENGTCILNSATSQHLEFARSLCAVLGVQCSQVRVQTRNAPLPAGGVAANHQIFTVNLNRHHLTADFFWLEHHKARASGEKQVRQYGWTVKLVEPTDRVEEVFCATVEGAGAFGLADGLMTGNCYLKPAHQVFSLIAEKPERAVWWAGQEKKAESFATGNGDKFRDDRASYAQMAKFAEQQTDMFDPDEEAIACFCGD